MSRLKINIFITGILLFYNISAVNATTSITTERIIPSALSLSCADYKIVGICYWLSCSFGCRVRTSIKVRHFIPDMVVSSYSNTGENPWIEAKMILKPLTISTSSMAQSGGDTNSRQAHNHTKVRFKEVDALGHPGGAVFSSMLSGMGYYCSNGVTPLYPYYTSSLDFLAWRQVPLEQFYPEALVPGVREIGSIFSANMWGNIYPRSGAVVQADDFKAAAVTAQRAADIFTNSGQAHVYRQYTRKHKDGFWPPSPVKENTNNHKWQILAPEMSNTCDTFPNLNKSPSQDGAYVFSLWRPYKCCKRRGQIFLYSIDWDN